YLALFPHHARTAGTTRRNRNRLDHPGGRDLAPPRDSFTWSVSRRKGSQCWNLPRRWSESPSPPDIRCARPRPAKPAADTKREDGAWRVRVELSGEDVGVAELPDDVYAEVQSLCAQGDALANNDEYDEALNRYRAAWQLL